MLARMDRYGTNLKRLMARCNLTVAQVAERSGLDLRTIRGVLNVRTTPHATTLHRLANGLGADVDELFAHRNGEMHPAVKSLVASQPALFGGWTAVEFDELERRINNASTDDVMEFLVAGATAVQLGTVNFYNPTVSMTILDELPGALAELEATCVKDVVGSLRT